MPVDRGVIDAQLRDIGEGERWWEQREFRDLPHVLHTDERIRGIINGKLLGRRRPRLRSGGPWLFVATDQRLICLQQQRFARRQVDIVAGQVTRVSQSSRLRSFQIVLETPQRRFRLRIAKEEASRFMLALGPLLNLPLQRLPGDIEQLSWIPGLTTVARLPGFSGIVSRVAMLSPPDYASRSDLERLEAVVESLQGEVERLQQHVAFLEDLLEKRRGAPSTSALVAAASEEVRAERE